MSCAHLLNIWLHKTKVLILCESRQQNEVVKTIYGTKTNATYVTAQCTYIYWPLCVFHCNTESRLSCCRVLQQYTHIYIYSLSVTMEHTEWPGSDLDCAEAKNQRLFCCGLPDFSVQRGTLISFFSFHTDKIHRCNALQSPSVHHRINQWERPRPSGVPASRITHEPQHDRSLLTTPKPVPYSQWKHTALSLLGKQDRNAVKKKKKKTFPTFHQLAICSSLRPHPSDIFNVRPGRELDFRVSESSTTAWITPLSSEKSSWSLPNTTRHNQAQWTVF